MFAIGSVHIQVREKQKTKPNLLLGFSNFIFFVIYPAGLIGLIAGFVLLEQKKDERVEHVLSSGSVSLTTAIVVKIEKRRMKSTTHFYAIIEYSAAGTKIEQAIKDDIRAHKEGDQVNIKYSMDYPDMFALLPR
ncbi:MAG: hypothetical protein EOO02_11255 [Chitinophagaceae bacterium]|nr:MAG: hypothetical protein EOO02_11255 [Chitinophagaceae bacterium]